MRANKYRSDKIVCSNINAVLLLLMMELASRKSILPIFIPRVPITLSLCHSNPLGCQRPERSSNGNGDGVERAWAKPKATHRLTPNACLSFLFSFSTCKNFHICAFSSVIFGLELSKTRFLNKRLQSHSATVETGRSSSFSFSVCLTPTFTHTRQTCHLQIPAAVHWCLKVHNAQSILLRVSNQCNSPLFRADGAHHIAGDSESWHRA